jgi:hypothetical protein
MFKTVLRLAGKEQSEHVASEVMLLHKTHAKVKDIIDRQWWRCVQIMHQSAIEDGAPPGALAHYLATFDSLNRMRALLDRPALHPQEEFPLERKPALGELIGKKQKAPDKPADALPPESV